MKKRTIISILLTALFTYITNPYWLIRNNGHSRFVIEVFIIIVVLSFLLLYKLTDYIADFKTIKDKSRVDIIFLSIFFVILFIPMSHINMENKSKQENRYLAKWKPLITEDNKINFNFGKDFESWFNDRFFQRTNFINTYSYLKYKIQAKCVNFGQTWIMKKNGHFFSDRFASNLYEPITQKELNTYSHNLYKFSEYCKKNNIKLYIVIPPIADDFYFEYNLAYAKIYDNAKKLVDFTKQKYEINIIYPKKEFLSDLSDEYIYFKTDHHLTDYGSYLLYKMLMQDINKNFPQIKTTPLSKFNVSKNNLVRAEDNRKFTNGCTYRSANLHNRKLLNSYYTYYDYKDLNNINIEKIQGTYNYKHTNKNGKYTLILLGDSFQENLAYFFDTSFKTVYKYRVNNGLTYPKRTKEIDIEKWDKIIKEASPDIIIFTMNSGKLKSLNTMY